MPAGFLCDASLPDWDDDLPTLERVVPCADARAANDSHAAMQASPPLVAPRAEHTSVPWVALALVVVAVVGAGFLLARAGMPEPMTATPLPVPSSGLGAPSPELDILPPEQSLPSAPIQPTIAAAPLDTERRSPASAVSLARAERRAGRPHAARIMLLAALRADPHDHRASAELARLEEASGRRELALVWARRARDVRPLRSDYRDLVAALEARVAAQGSDTAARPVPAPPLRATKVGPPRRPARDL